MAAPPFVPVDPVDRPRAYQGPDHVPARWTGGRPADIAGRQPGGERLGSQGPDQGYALLLAERVRSRVLVGPGESVEDALRGCLGIALRRASLFGRAPVIHDLHLALTIWGFLDSQPPTELVTRRRAAFEGVANVIHHYAEARAIVDSVPDATLKMSVAQVEAAYPGQWRNLLGV
jgi:hypothetical protein